MTQLEYKFFYRRTLPHYQSPGATLFVTIRLADSLPKSVLIELQAEAERVERELAGYLTLLNEPDRRTSSSEGNSADGIAAWTLQRQAHTGCANPK